MNTQSQSVRWDCHQNQLQAKLLRFMGWGRFCDITLACEGGQILKAHRAILCASSRYFDSILNNSTIDKETLIIMRDCHFDEIKLLIEFMYKGEITIETDRIPSIRKLAEDLQITGLTEALVEVCRTQSYSTSTFSDHANPTQENPLESDDSSSKSSTERRSKRNHRQSSIADHSMNMPQITYAQSLNPQVKEADSEEQWLPIIPKEEITDYDENNVDAISFVDSDYDTPMMRSSNLRFSLTTAANKDEPLCEYISNRNLQLISTYLTPHPKDDRKHVNKLIDQLWDKRKLCTRRVNNKYVRKDSQKSVNEALRDKRRPLTPDKLEYARGEYIKRLTQLAYDTGENVEIRCKKFIGYVHDHLNNKRKVEQKRRGK